MAAVTPPVPERTAHPFLTHDEILDIPESVRATLRTVADVGPGIAERLRGRGRLAFTGCGTAFYTAEVGAGIVSAVPGLSARVQPVPALELERYSVGWGRGSAVVGVSHSGITKATVDALRAARSQGARTVAMTHFRNRPIAAVSDDVLVAGDSPDRSRCHTKCFAAGAAALAALSLHLEANGSSAERADFARGLEGLPSLATEVLRSTEPRARELAAAHLGRRAIFVAGAGPNEGVAHEVALKFMEASYVVATGLETEEMIHGPWQSADADTLALVIAPKGRTTARSLDLVRALRALGAPVVAVVTEGDREVSREASAALEVPETAEALSPLLTALPLYLLAYHSSVLRGRNPDVLRYLTPEYWRARQIVFPPGTH